VSTERKTKARLRIFQEVYRLVCDDILGAHERTVTVVLHGRVLHLQLFVQCMILDGTEAQSAACTRSSCPMCMCPASMFSLDKADRDKHASRRRTNVEMCELISECRGAFTHDTHVYMAVYL
jgi:hypothetical protein